VPRVVVTPRALEDLHDLIVGLGLPSDAPSRVRRSLRILERFPLAGRTLAGRWEGARFLIGAWPWMVLVYVHDEAADAVFVVAIHDGRSASSATGRRG
jgi:plasmid stabilization system protein ParE